MTIARLMQQAAAGSAGAGPAPSGWTDPDLANASYDSVSFIFAGQVKIPLGLAISEDGSKFYVSDNNTDSVFQYNLSTPWDLTSTSYSGNSLRISQDGTPFALSFKPDGLKMYLLGTNTDTVYQYGLTTAWDISTASYDSVSFSVASLEPLSIAVRFKTDGTKMYILGRTNNSVLQYALSTAWDITTASYESKSLSVSSQETVPISMFISPTGSAVYVLGNSNDTVYQYDLGTAWDISTGVYNASETFDVGGIVDNQYGLTFKSDGSKMYTISLTTDTIYQYSTAAAAPVEWTDPDLGNASYDSVSFSVAGQETSPLSVAISEDGSKFYVSGNVNNAVFQYNLSTPWDITTTSYSGDSLDVSSQEGIPYNVSFKPDGLKMYLMGTGTDTVYQYSLTTAWEISTASYDSVSFSVASQDSSPSNVRFKGDGSTMYILGRTNNTIFQYTLSTPWDVSTASYDSKSLDASSQEPTLISMFISPTGSAVYVLGNTNDTVYQYDLSTAWDISTGVYNSSQTFDVSGVAGNQYGLNFKSDGSKMYTIAFATDRIYQYST